MTQQAMADFFSALPENPALAEGFRDVVARHEGAAAIEAVARFVSEAGYDVSVADAAKFRSGVMEALEDSDLSEDNLEKVAGGVVETLMFGALLATPAVMGGLGVATGALGVVAVGAIVDRNFANSVNDFLTKW